MKKLYVNIDKAKAEYNKKNNSALTQMEFCKKFGITTMTYNNYKAGKKPDYLRTLHDLMKETGLQYNQIIKIK